MKTNFKAFTWQRETDKKILANTKYIFLREEDAEVDIPKGWAVVPITVTMENIKLSK